MKKTNWYFVAILFIGALIFQACDNDDGYPTGNFLITIATVERDTDGEESIPYFVWDNQEAVNVAISWVPFKNLPTGQRVLGNFTLLTDRSDKFSHDVRLNNYATILTKEVIDLTEANADSIGNDPVYITKMWISNNYLNIMFDMVHSGREPHLVNLVRNTIDKPDESDNYVHLEYRYNNMGDVYGRTVSSIVSFDLNEFNNSTYPNQKGFKVKINSIVNGDRIITFNYPIKEEVMTTISLEGVSSENID